LVDLTEQAVDSAAFGLSGSAARLGMVDIGCNGKRPNYH
jgi:hypothetical protein